MEMLEKPEIKSKYDKCKYKVKHWEHQFKKKNGRLPSKLDIKESSQDIRYAYKTYYNLKSAALEKSFQDIDAFNFDDEDRENLGNYSNTSIAEVSCDAAEKTEESLADNNPNSSKTWGAHLSNVHEPKTIETRANITTNTSFTQKLFKNSGLSKRNPRKSLSFTHRKSESKIELTSAISMTQPNLLTSCDNPNSSASQVDHQIDDNINVNIDNVRFTKLIEPVPSKSLNFMQSILDDDNVAVRQVDVGWMKRVAATIGTKLKNKSLSADNFCFSQQIAAKPSACVVDDDDEVINDSDDEDIHFSKRQKLNCLQTNKVPNHNLVSETKQQLQTNQTLPSNNAFNEQVRNSKEPTIKVIEDENDNQTAFAIETNKTNNQTVLDDNSDDNDPDYSIDSEINSNVKKNKRIIRRPKNRNNAKSTKRNISKSTKEVDTHDEDAAETYELEYSVKPRRVTVPRDRSLKNVIKNSRNRRKQAAEDDPEPAIEGIKSKDEVKLEKLEKKISSGNLNENFVRINIQKKIYARGKKTMTFSKYKKQMWKQNKKNNALCGPNMNMGGCDGGKLTCFTCGQVGHFAAKCPNEKGAQLLPIVAEEDYCPYPTLEEASQMAKGSQLAVRMTRTQPAADKEIPEENDDTSSDEENEYCRNMFDDGIDADLLAETLQLEEYIKRYDEAQLVDDEHVIKPYYKLNPNGNVQDTPAEVRDALNLFGYESFRPGQEKAIMRILSGKSTLVTLSTGSGKSFCYQLPAYLYSQREACIVLVISPLVSLMEDQVVGIPKFLKAECLHTNKTKLQRERILKTLAEGDLHILLVSPEAVVAGEKQTGFGSLLRKLPPIAFACIDEAHCVSQWSHNFRPSYLMICSILKERLGVKTILGLTATATRATCASIISHLAISDGDQGIISDTPLPNNLRLTVSKDAQRDQALLNLLLSERFEHLNSVIIYCIRRQECERIAGFLRTSLKYEKSAKSQSNNRKRKKTNVCAEPYHAGLAASKRKSIQNSFMRGDLRIVVATVAFGMGINKSDIRAVIHYNLPRSFESYVQEVGRAGRDGLPAHCHLFLDTLGRDENELQRHIYADSIDRHVIRKLLGKIFVSCTCKGVCPKHEVAFSVAQTVELLDIPEENIATLLCYLELHERKYIEVLSPAYVTCKVLSYGSGNIIRKASKDCPPLAMALAMFAHKQAEDIDNVFEFPIVDVAAAMGWDSGICKYKLKNLEWITENNQPKRSLLTVQLSNLGFRLLAPGNLSEEQLDDALDTLHQRVVEQEKCSLLQLRSLHETVTQVAENSYRMCISDHISDYEVQLKHCIRDYFESPTPLAKFALTAQKCDEGLIENDVRAMIGLYRDNNFTGRAIARIFYGIQSPNYPAVVWGRCKYWRAHITIDFHQIVRIATRVILQHR